MDFLNGISLLHQAQKNTLLPVQSVSQCHDLATIKSSSDFKKIFLHLPVYPNNSDQKFVRSNRIFINIITHIIKKRKYADAILAHSRINEITV